MKKAPKYPRMKHLPWSEAVARDDKCFDKIENAMFYGSDDVVVTEKLDGSNVCLTRENLFARSHGHEPRHESFDMLKKMYHEELKHRIPEGLAVYGEWLYAVHSIRYDSLPSYLFVFDVLDMQQRSWLSFDTVVDISQILGLHSVPVVYRGAWIKEIREMSPEGKSEYSDKREGLVVRCAGSFAFEDFDKAVGKVVRKGHVSTDEHWRDGKIERNKREDETPVYSL